MTPLRLRWLALAAGAGIVVAVVLRALTDGPVPTFPWATVAALLVLAAVVLAMGWRVRAHVRDPRGRPIDPIFASRVAVLAQACALFGALAAGWGAGLLVNELALLRYRDATGSLGMTAADLVTGVVLCTAGCLAEHWCKRPPEDSEGNDDGVGTSRRPEISEGEGGYARDLPGSPGPQRDH